ncbi:hypothetical protein M6D81_29290 [Paenibacillus sp. J5C_2022]|uniref:hypothetical protein n=1 Tax=Paenibacillus sp. J5C2022 TaxID=2977129 RepID=UPI0021CFDEC5|nr:hypothetical protein [Paenibacillus sp. J5C2022]MCU6712804.1 hypothetical protein [Paenibacillus sp. J5C2022]
MKKWLVIALSTLLLAAGCSNSNGNDEQGTPSEGPSAPVATVTPAPPVSTDEPVTATEEPQVAATSEEAAAALIAALKESDLATLQSYIHPEKGLLFSPYVHIDTDTAQVFQREQLPDMEDATEYEWGEYDGIGDPIKLTFKQYYEKFVYNQDFMNAEETGWDEIKGSGNSIPNIKDVYPDSYLVDYYFSGFNEDFEGMDWESLILVLEEYNGGWYIVAIAHSQWTI